MAGYVAKIGGFTMQTRVQIRVPIRDKLLLKLFQAIPDEIVRVLPRVQVQVDQVVYHKVFGASYTLAEARRIEDQNIYQWNCTPLHLFGQAWQFGPKMSGRFFALDWFVVGASGCKFFPYYETAATNLMVGLKIESERFKDDDRVLIIRTRDYKL